MNESPGNTKETLCTIIELLMKPESYPFSTIKIERLETNMSWIFLTEQYVYKLKKPVVMDKIDLSTVEKRYLNCLKEIQLNQRLARGVYLGVVPVVLNQKGLIKLGGHGKAIDWMVWMKRLPAEKMLDKAITLSSLNQKELVSAAKMLADFYVSSRPIDLSLSEYTQWIIHLIRQDRRKMFNSTFYISEIGVKRIADALTTFVYKNVDLIASRVLNNRVIEAHGDLRPEHVYLGQPPAFIDCLEFSKSLRIMDCVEELSFFALECDMIKADQVGHLFFEVYKKQSGDQFPEELVAFYKAKRAFLKARLSVRHLQSSSTPKEEKIWKDNCLKYLQVAKIYIQWFGGKV